MNLDHAIQEKHNIIVEFYSDWSASSFIMGELLKQLQRDYSEKFDVFFINADQSRRRCKTYGIRKIPTLLFFQHGKIVKTLEGTASCTDLIELIEYLFLSKQDKRSDT
jgi:thioredoxin 1